MAGLKLELHAEIMIYTILQLMAGGIEITFTVLVVASMQRVGFCSGALNHLLSYALSATLVESQT